MRKALLFILICGPLLAQEPFPPCWTGLRHTELDGVGYRCGYTSLEAVVSPEIPASSLSPFLDLRTHFLNNGDFAANVGLGARHELESADRSWGVNAYYDYRSGPDFTSRSQPFHQVGLGLEFFSSNFDVRINAYCPIGKRSSKERFFDRFESSDLYMLQRTALAMPGFEIEVGRDFAQWGGIDFYSALQPYFFFAKDEKYADYGDDAFGLSARVIATWKHFEVTAGFSWDTAFDLNALLQISIGLPSGTTASNRVLRRDLIVLQKHEETVLARCPSLEACDRYHVIHVNNTGVNVGAATKSESPGSPDGSWEYPFLSLSDAEASGAACDIIVVHAGDGTTTGYSEGITLADDQVIMGSGTALTLPTCQGALLVPALCPGQHPRLTASGDGVRLASRNLVSGLWIDEVGGSGISGSGIESATIVYNTITSPSGDGLNFDDLTGQLLVAHNVIESSGQDSIEIDNDGSGVLAATIHHNVLRDSVEGGLRIDLADDGNYSFRIEDNKVFAAEDGHGIAVDANGTVDVTAYVNRNTITETVGDGIHFDIGDDSTLSFEARCNHVFQVADGNGIYVAVGGGARVSKGNLFKNSILKVFGGDGIDLDVSGSANAAFHLVKNCIVDVDDHCVELRSSGSSNVSLIADLNEMMISAGRGFNLEASGASTFNAAFAFNISRQEVFSAASSDDATVNLQVIGNELSSFDVSNGGGTVNFEDTEERNFGPFSFIGDITIVPENSLLPRSSWND